MARALRRRAPDGPFTPAHCTAILFAGVVAILFAGVGPFILGALQAGGRLDAEQLGQAGTVELVAMGLAAAFAAPLERRWGVRPLMAGCGLFTALCNGLITQLSGYGLVGACALVGLPCGVLIWMVTALIVRMERPERWAAFYLTIQTVAQLAVVTAAGVLARSATDVVPGVAILVVLSLAVAAVTPLAPAAFAPLGTPHAHASGTADASAASSVPALAGIAALAAQFCYNAATLGLWVYFSPLLREAGMATGLVVVATSAALAGQVVGGVLATAIAPRLSFVRALAVSLVVMIGVLGIFALAAPSTTLLMGAAILFGFLWMFAAPLLTPLTIAADPTRQAASLGSGASLLGCGAGPFAASLLVSDAHVRASAAMTAGFLALTLLLVALLAVFVLSPRARRTQVGA
ncbi:MFS transporter [Novosphingobium sp. 1949]|uniref:MFS transporter n=1 Tax=Novosphingobium organovorum TaxID=2930092 RepID=A0ABT0BG15_9SPHN|nr:MFS transporter [Novosphingobium organovorum]MCJ2183979.1 MFS transporter [Novosphingobium organovorum]